MQRLLKLKILRGKYIFTFSVAIKYLKKAEKNKIN